MPVERLAWTLTVAAGLVAAALFVRDGLNGYALLAALLAIAASVNVLPGGED